MTKGLQNKAGCANVRRQGRRSPTWFPDKYLDKYLQTPYGGATTMVGANCIPSRCDKPVQGWHPVDCPTLKYIHACQGSRN